MPETLKVGSTKIFDPKKGKERKFSYRDVQYDADKWVDANKFLPADFDLVYLKVIGRMRLISAWSNGDKWEGANFKPNFRVLSWRRHEGV